MQHEPVAKLLSSFIAPPLRLRGFSRRGQSFTRWDRKNCQVINFQVWKERSTDSTTVFTVNLGVFSGALFWFETGLMKPKKSPSVEICHWRTRLGNLLPDRQDKWWSIEQDSEIPSISEEILSAMEAHALPVLGHLDRDEALRELWLTGSSPGLNDFERLKHLSALLLMIGPQSELERVLQDLAGQATGTPWEGSAHIHISKIRELRKA